MTDDEKYARIQLSNYHGVGAKTFFKIVDHFGSASGFLKLKIAEKTAALPQVDWYQELPQEIPLEDAWVYGEDAYPYLLSQINDPPPVLYKRGVLTTLPSANIVSIVGTRRYSVYGKTITQRITRELTANHFTVVSGLASGIDSIAHAEVLSGRGQTVAVMGTELFESYPRRNHALYESILSSGLVCSEYYHPVAVTAGLFPRRNRIIAGLAQATIVIEAPEKSGALITARLALEYNRDVYAVPGDITRVSCIGCNNLIKNGGAQLLTDVSQVLENSGVAIVEQADPLPGPPLSELEQQLVDNLKRQPSNVDELLDCVHINVSELLSALTMLEIKHCIIKEPNGTYTLII